MPSRSEQPLNLSGLPDSILDAMSSIDSLRFAVHLLQKLSTATFREAIRARTKLPELPLKDVFCRMSSLPSVAMFFRHCNSNQRRYVPQTYIYSTDPTPAEICRFEYVCKNTKLTLFYN